MSKKYYERLAQTSVSSKKFECDFGLKVLKKFGWSEGKGLGKNEDGIDAPIQIKKREKDVGIGADSAVAEAQWDNWWADTFNAAARKNKIRSDDTMDDTASTSSSDNGQGGRVTAIKNASRMKGKLARVVRQEAGEESDSSVGLTSFAERLQERRIQKRLPLLEVIWKEERLDDWYEKKYGNAKKKAEQPKKKAKKCIEDEQMIEVKEKKSKRRSGEIEEVKTRKAKKRKCEDVDGDIEEQGEAKKRKSTDETEIVECVEEVKKEKKKKKKRDGESA